MVSVPGMGSPGSSVLHSARGVAKPTPSHGFVRAWPGTGRCPRLLCFPEHSAAASSPRSGWKPPFKNLNEKHFKVYFPFRQGLAHLLFVAGVPRCLSLEENSTSKSSGSHSTNIFAPFSSEVALHGARWTIMGDSSVPMVSWCNEGQIHACPCCVLVCAQGQRPS